MRVLRRFRRFVKPGFDRHAGLGDHAEFRFGGQWRREDAVATSGSKGRPVLSKVKDGVLSSGTVHVKISGDKSAEFDTEGSAFVQGGFALITFGSEKSSTIITLANSDDADAGGMVINTTDLATGGGWAMHCDIAVQDSEDDIRGDIFLRRHRPRFDRGRRSRTRSMSR